MPLRHIAELLFVAGLVYFILKAEIWYKRWKYSKDKNPVAGFPKIVLKIYEVQGAADPIICTRCGQAERSYAGFSDGQQICEKCEPLNG